MPILPCLVAFCQAFPPLYDDVAALLVQVGQVCASDVATKARDIDPLIARKFAQSLGWHYNKMLNIKIYFLFIRVLFSTVYN